MGPVHRPRLKLSDFGLAKSLVDSRIFANLTRQGDVGGSIGFLSPEHILKFGEVREPADIYCAGATLFFLLTEKYPFLGFDPRRTDSYEMILENPPIPLRAFRPDAPEGLERVLLKALKKKPARPVEVGLGDVASPPAVRPSPLGLTRSGPVCHPLARRPARPTNTAQPAKLASLVTSTIEPTGRPLHPLQAFARVLALALFCRIRTRKPQGATLFARPIRCPRNWVCSSPETIKPIRPYPHRHNGLDRVFGLGLFVALRGDHRVDRRPRRPAECTSVPGIKPPNCERASGARTAPFTLCTTECKPQMAAQIFQTTEA